MLADRGMYEIFVEPARGHLRMHALNARIPAPRHGYPLGHQERDGLVEIMREIHNACRSAADEYGMPGDYAAGANIAGFVRVADAMLALGLI